MLLFNIYVLSHNKYFLIRYFRGICSSVEMQKRYMARERLGAPDLDSFIGRIFRASKSSFSAFRKLINAFSFFPRNNGRGGLTNGLAQGPHQLNPALTET